jgi:hypothetical protein
VCSGAAGRCSGRGAPAQRVRSTRHLEPGPDGLENALVQTRFTARQLENPAVAASVKNKKFNGEKNEN